MWPELSSTWEFLRRWQYPFLLDPESWILDGSLIDSLKEPFASSPVVKQVCSIRNRHSAWRDSGKAHKIISSIVSERSAQVKLLTANTRQHGSSHRFIGTRGSLEGRRRDWYVVCFAVRQCPSPIASWFLAGMPHGSNTTGIARIHD